MLFRPLSAVCAMLAAAIVSQIGCGQHNSSKARAVLILRATSNQKGKTQYLLAANSFGMDYAEEQMWRFPTLKSIAKELGRYPGVRVYLNTGTSAQKTTRRLDAKEMAALSALTTGLDVTFRE